MSNNNFNKDIKLNIRSVILCLALTGCASQTTPIEPKSPWSQMTRIDVEAAYKMLSEDHPGMAESVNDDELKNNMAAGYAKALERAKQVESFEGYLATMSALSMAAGDKHVWSRTSYKAKSVKWTGLMISRQGDDYVVTSDEEQDEEKSLVGYRLVSCDNVAVDTFAKDKLGEFHAVWSIEAQRIQKTPYLLIDDGNPFVLRPQNCQFEKQQQQVSRNMEWQTVKRTELKDKIRAASNRGAAGHGVKEFEKGYWIGLQTLGKKAGDVVAEVQAKQALLKQAEVVVLDVRGNGGGNSTYGDQIARVLFDNADESKRTKHNCDVVWRVSNRNLKQMEYYVDAFSSSMPEFVEGFKPKLELAKSAFEQDKDFTGPTECSTTKPEAEESAVKKPMPKAKKKVVLLTDNTCFSSCLIVTDRFKKLGALHIGQPTDANTHYMEVREDVMPSGLSHFSTLQAMSPASPKHYGLFIPDVMYHGDIADTRVLKNWVSKLIEN